MAAPRILRALIVDDEALARQRVEDLLRSDTSVEIVGTADNGDAAINAIHTLEPDLVFLDVQMPGKTGFEVVREIGPDHMPATVFITAYDQYALKAFDVAAVDYLVKPFDDERFEQALQRARRMIELEEVGRLSERLLAVLQDEHRTVRRTEYLERIAVEMRGQVRVVRTPRFIPRTRPISSGSECKRWKKGSIQRISFACIARPSCGFSRSTRSCATLAAITP